MMFVLRYFCRLGIGSGVYFKTSPVHEDPVKRREYGVMGWSEDTGWEEKRMQEREGRGRERRVWELRWWPLW